MTKPVKASEVKAEKSQRREVSKRRTAEQIVMGNLDDDPRLAERMMLRQHGEAEVERLKRIAEGLE